MEPLGRHLVFTAKAVKERFEGLLAAQGSSLPQLLMMNALAEEPGLSQRELGTAMRLMGPTVTHHLDRFEQDGLISRTRDQRDRRVTRVALTPAGKRHHARIRTVAQAHDAGLRSMLGERDAEALSRILTRLQHQIAEETDA